LCPRWELNGEKRREELLIKSSLLTVVRGYFWVPSGAEPESGSRGEKHPEHWTEYGKSYLWYGGLKIGIVRGVVDVRVFFLLRFCGCISALDEVVRLNR
jgi:hypothetical protein